MNTATHSIEPTIYTKPNRRASGFKAALVVATLAIAGCTSEKEESSPTTSRRAETTSPAPTSQAPTIEQMTTIPHITNPPSTETAETADTAVLSGDAPSTTEATSFFESPVTSAQVSVDMQSLSTFIDVMGVTSRSDIEYSGPVTNTDGTITETISKSIDYGMASSIVRATIVHGQPSTPDSERVLAFSISDMPEDPSNIGTTNDRMFPSFAYSLDDNGDWDLVITDGNFGSDEPILLSTAPEAGSVGVSFNRFTQERSMADIRNLLSDINDVTPSITAAG